MVPTNLFFTSLALVGLHMSSLALASSNNNLNKNNMINNNNNKMGQSSLIVKTCIDDSDCTSIPGGARCFGYICYPWPSDKAILPEERKTKCRKDGDCSPDQECFRHPEKRAVKHGLCFDKDKISDCESSNDCINENKCCGGYCCEDKYFQTFKQLSCSSDILCQDLSLGQFCCPSGNNTKVCCDTDPNPKPKPTHSQSVEDNAAHAHNVGVAAVSVSVLVTLAVSKLL